MAQYIIENRATVRSAAQKFGISKSTVHKDLSERLPTFNQPLYEQVKAVLEASREREEAQSRELEELRRERDSLRRRVAELEPGAAAYTAVKERAAGVELEAHCRAQNVLNEADGQARELRRGMEQWLGRVQVEYDALRSEVESTVSHAADQLEKAGKCLEQVTALLADQDVALEELSRAYDSTDREKVPAPMPLTEL